MVSDFKELENIDGRWTLTSLELKCWLLRRKGLSNKEIRRQLRVDPRSVPGYINRFIENYKELYKIVNILREAPFKEIETDQPKHFREAFTRKFKDGYHMGPAPDGYKKINGELEQIPERAKVIEELFIGFDEGFSIGYLSRKYKLGYHKVLYILRNPVYKGDVSFRRVTRKGRHKPIVSEELFGRVQEKLKKLPPFAFYALPPGWIWKKGIIEYDDDVKEEIDKAKEMFKLRKESLSFAEIGRHLDVSEHTVITRIKNPFYCGMKWKNGKLVHYHNKGILTVDEWRDVNKIHTPRQKAAVEKAKDIGEKNRNTILTHLSADGKTVSEIAKETGFADTIVRKHLYKLEEGGYVERVSPTQTKKGACPFPTKWRVRM